MKYDTLRQKTECNDKKYFEKKNLKKYFEKQNDFLFLFVFRTLLGCLCEKFKQFERKQWDRKRTLQANF